MPPSLYQNLKDLSQDNIRLRMKLDALHLALRQSGIKSGREWDILAECLLKLELNPVVLPADDKMKKLMSLYEAYKANQ